MRGETAKATALAAEADRVARAALVLQPDATEIRIELAAVSALRQDTTAALEWLRCAYDGGYRNYSFLERDPILRRQIGTDPSSSSSIACAAMWLRSVSVRWRVACSR